MNIAIFSGGAGTRFWPLSRVNSPKQFDKVFNGKSTFRLTLDRALLAANKSNVFIGTNVRYKKQISQQAREIPSKNFFWEPEMRDVGPAVGLVTAVFEKLNPAEPMAIIWSDHLVESTKGFARMLKIAENYVSKNPEKIVFLGVPPRFANENLGWIHTGNRIKDQVSNIRNIRKEKGFEFFSFEGWHYRPSLELAKEFLDSKKWFWNTGYFVTTPGFLMNKFRMFQPDMAVGLEKIAESYGSKDFEKKLAKIYPSLEKISFDNAVIEKIDKEDALVLTGDIGWSDVGTLYALKEALVGNGSENMIKGNVYDLGSCDSLFYNTNGELLVTIGLKGMIVVRTPDATLVCSKEEVPNIKKVLKELAKTKLRNHL